LDELVVDALRLGLLALGVVRVGVKDQRKLVGNSEVVLDHLV
jgi:hypothetical protein